MFLLKILVLLDLHFFQLNSNIEHVSFQEPIILTKIGMSAFLKCNQFQFLLLLTQLIIMHFKTVQIYKMYHFKNQ